ncbi:MAG: hypothetical protein GC192_12160 [Bacteroidetes bacterium]|nr:hypothetical protein [Bacteroidota bacterium]
MFLVGQMLAVNQGKDATHMLGHNFFSEEKTVLALHLMHFLFHRQICLFHRRKKFCMVKNPLFVPKYLTMKNIQFLTDYSDHSRQVYQYALHLALHFEATVTVTHIFAPHYPTAMIDMPDIPSDNAADQIEKYLDTQWDKERERMDYFITDHTPKQFKDVVVKKEIGYGNVGEEILRMQTHFACDLIVMGMEKQNSLASKLLGSTALNMIDHANIPVLLIPHTAQFEGIKRILFPTSLHPTELKIVRYLLEWTRAFNAKLICFHAHSNNHKESDDFTNGLHLAKKQFEAAIERDEVDFVVIEAHTDGLVAAIEAEMGIVNADLLVMRTHHRGMFAHLFEESTTKTVVSEVFVPVLVLKGAIFDHDFSASSNGATKAASLP